MKVGARNQIEATVVSVKTGDGIGPNDKVRVVVKAVHVLVIRD